MRTRRHQQRRTPPTRAEWSGLPGGVWLLAATLALALAGVRGESLSSRAGVEFVDPATGQPQRLDSNEVAVQRLPTPALSELFIDLSVSRAVAERGDALDYRVELRNDLAVTLDQPFLTAMPPPGLRYRRGSCRLGGQAGPEPTVARDGSLSFALPPVAAKATLSVIYRLVVAATTPLGAAVNRARWQGITATGPAVSREASAGVTVYEGVFTDRGLVCGRVYADAPGAPGVPGVSVYLEDGSFAVTDGAGQYSLYGVRPGTRVAKLDPLTVPAGARWLPLTHRHARDGRSCLVDLKNSELHEVDFAIGAPTPAVLAELARRRAALDAEPSEVQRGLTQALPPGGVPAEPGDVRGRPAQGRLGTESAATPAGPPPPAPTGPPARESLAAAVAELDNRLGFVGLRDGARLADTQLDVRCRGQAGATLSLWVNGTRVDDQRIGRRVLVPERQLEAREYLGVVLVPGLNRLELVQADGFGNERGRCRVTVVAPGQPAQLRLELPSRAPSADGVSLVLLKVSLLDSHGLALAARTPLTLEASLGRWAVTDLDPLEPGVQVFLTGGSAEFALLAPDTPGECLVTVHSGALRADATLRFVPFVRPLFGAGTLDARLGGGQRRGVGLSAPLADPFDSSLRQLWRLDPDVQVGARAAAFFKGRVAGDSLLTVGYDSDKGPGERLFRDLEPDAFYPVYGDSSRRGFDAQSTSRLYARLDHGAASLLYGDYATGGPSDTPSLGAFYRSLTGAKGHYESGAASVDLYGSHNRGRQVVQEFAANGTSGPFTLGTLPFSENSERVEVLVRDRHQPARILSSRDLTRFTDYELEAFSGALVLRAPLATLDADLNPLSLRVTYEVEQGGPASWLYGFNAKVAVSRGVRLGGAWVRDENPADLRQLRSFNVAAALGRETSLLAEVAQTLHSGARDGLGERFELNHRGQRLSGRLFAGRTDVDFDNPSAPLSLGRGEYGLKGTYLLDPRTRLALDALRSEDRVSHQSLDGYSLSAQRQLSRYLGLEVGVRHARGSVAATITGATGETRASFTSLRALLRGSLPSHPAASAYGEYERDVTDGRKQVLAVGGEYQLKRLGRLYARHEFLSSLAGRYLLDTTHTQHATLVGLDSEYMPDGHLFSEYRRNDAFSGRDTEAAIGLRNAWRVARGVTANTGFEQLKGLGGRVDNSSTALTGALEYTRSPHWLGSVRLEQRWGTTSDGLLATLGVARRLSGDWTLLARTSFNGTTQHRGGSRHQQRTSLGAAWRESRRHAWYALLRYELQADYDSTVAERTDTVRHLLSADLSYRPDARTAVRAHWAARSLSSRTAGWPTHGSAQVATCRATRDLGRRGDVGLLAAGLWDQHARAASLGCEGGLSVAANLWLSAGYNWLGFKSGDLAAEDYTDRGPYVRVRYRFDEGLFGQR